MNINSPKIREFFRNRNPARAASLGAIEGVKAYNRFCNRSDDR